MALLVVACLALLLVTIAARVPLSSPLRTLAILLLDLLLLLRSPLLFGDAALVELSPLLLGPELVLIALILCPALLIDAATLRFCFRLTFLIKAAAIRLPSVLPLLIRVALLIFSLASLDVILALLIDLTTLFPRLTLLFPLPPLLSALLILLLTLCLTLLLACLTLLLLGLSLLLLRLPFVAAALFFGLSVLLIVPATPATSLGLRLRRLLFVLLPPLSTLPLPILAVLRLLRLSKTGRSGQRNHTDDRSQRDASKIIDFHDYLHKERAEGKVKFAAIIAITIPTLARHENPPQAGSLIRYRSTLNHIGHISGTGSR